MPNGTDTDTSDGCKSVDIPNGMRAWHGGDLAPDDWDGGDVLLRDGTEGIAEDWRHLHGVDDDGDDMSDCDIIGYWPSNPNIDLRLAYEAGFSQALHNARLSPSEFFEEWRTAGQPATLFDKTPRLIAAIEFLIDRLVDYEIAMTSDEDAKEWHGHVRPAMARLRDLLPID